MGYWQWMRFNESRVPTGKKLLRISLDETCVSMAPETGTGLIIMSSAAEAMQYVSKHDARTNFTYVALVCDDEALQKSMPHFIVGSKSKMTNECYEKLCRENHANVHVWRTEHKAWNNSWLLQRMLKVLSEQLLHRTDLQPVLIMDVAPCHLHESVLREARSLGIWVMYVPAQLTFLLQVLDTHGFASFKNWLRKEYKRLQSVSVDGTVDRLLWLRVLQKAKADFFDSKSWAKGFQATGARRPCVCFTKEIQKYVHPKQARAAKARKPTEETLKLFWPRRRKMLYGYTLLFQEQPMAPHGQASQASKPVKRPAPGLTLSIALASRANKRACRQYPNRDVAGLGNSLS